MPLEPTAPLVLAIEDEPQVLRYLRAALPAHGYRFAEATRGAQGLIEASTRVPDLMLLDLGLPDMDGVTLVRRLREWSRMPVIVISARSEYEDKIDALDAGADDYLTKPFDTGELMARIRVALRHRARPEGASGPFRVGELEVDLEARRVSVDDAEVRLTRTEYKLLSELVRHAGKVLTHRHLLKEVWGPGAVQQNHY